MKIVTLNTDHTNTNYDNCLKHALLLIAKEEADIIAFHEVRFGCYGFIRNYQHFKELNNHLEESVRLEKPFGELLLSRQKFRDIDYHDNVISYFCNNFVVSLSRNLKNETITNHLRSFTLPNGNLRPTILIDPQNVWLLTTQNEQLIPISKQKQTGASKYPLNITYCDVEV